MSVNKKLSATNDQEIVPHRNEDPITGELGAHPIGAGVGAALGSVASGALVGSVAGPAGTVVGAIAGGIVGGIAGKAFAEGYDPTVEASHWRQEYQSRPYYSDEYSYEHYEPAYRAGWESFDPDVNADWVDREAIAREQWENKGGPAYMTWAEARQASQDAYDRVNGSTERKP